MRFSLLIVAGLFIVLLAVCQAQSSEIDVQSVLSSQRATEVGYDAPSKLLKIIKSNPGDDKAWQALHHYRSLTDAGLTLMFFHDCFNALREKPLLFFDRYMTGDEQALFRMVDSLSHDFSAFTGETFQVTDQVLQKSLSSIVETMNLHSLGRKAYQRAYDFKRISRAQYESWKLRYCELMMRDGEVIAKNCAAWEKQ